MRFPSTDPTIEISTSSGTLRVTVHPARTWLIFPVEFVVLIAFVAQISENWGKMSPLLRYAFVGGIMLGAIRLIFRSGVEIIEIDAEKITLSKDARGWERKRQYRINECRELEWMQSTEDNPQRLQCKVGWKTVTFGAGLTENQAIEILTALQQTLPNAAQQLCSYPEGKKHFITLGLS